VTSQRKNGTDCGIAVPFAANAVQNPNNPYESRRSVMSLPIIPTVAEVLAGVPSGESVHTVVAVMTIGKVAPHTSVDVELSRFDALDDEGIARPSEWEVEFSKGEGSSSIHPSEVPALIDTLTEMYRAYLDLTAGGDLK